jgi:PBSX family phage terminase large subunit
MFGIRSADASRRSLENAIKRINSIRTWFPKQQVFLDCEARHTWQMAASQSGKTEVATPKFLKKILRKQKRLREKHGRWMDAAYWVVLPTYDILAPVKTKIKHYLPYRSGLIDREAQGRSKGFWSTKQGVAGKAFMKYGASITFKSFEQGEGLVAESAHGIWIDECARCDDTDTWFNLFARLKETGGWTIGTSSPAKRAAFYLDIYKRFQDDPDHAWLTWTAYDSAASPKSRITVEELDRQRKTMPKHSFARENLAEWAAAEGMIYDHFDFGKNVVKELPFSPEPKFIIGVDVGASHPTSMEVVRFDGEKFIVTEEVTLESTIVSDIVKSMVELFFRYKPQKIYYDYGGGGAFVALEWDNFWSRAARGKVGKTDQERMKYQLAAPKAKVCLERAYKNVNDGIMMCNAAFAAGTLLIADKCKNLLEEVDGYVWQDGGKTGDDKPVKENDDHLDAMRYAVATFAAQYMSTAATDSVFGAAA